ncbi:MAG: hypothetical protein AB8C46_00490 [Burkholderiaceae bacterium]
MNSIFQRVVPVFVALAISGCAASVQQSGGEDTAIRVPVEAAKRIVLVMDGTQVVTSSEDWGAFVSEWQAAISGAAAAQGLDYTYRVPGKAPDDLPGTEVLVFVNDYRYLTESTRALAGIFSGNAFTDSTVTYSVLPGGQKAGTKTYKTTSSALQGIFSAMTTKQVRALAQQIVNDVISR